MERVSLPLRTWNGGKLRNTIQKLDLMDSHANDITGFEEQPDGVPQAFKY